MENGPQGDVGPIEAKKEETPLVKPKSENNEKKYLKSFAGREHIYKNHAFYAFRYVCMLLSGGGFLASLIGILSLTISKFVNGDSFSISSYLGGVYANLVTAVVILGIIHLLLSITVGDNWKADDGEKKKYPIVLSVIYCVAIGAAIVVFLISSIGTAFGAAISLNSSTGSDILEQVLISLVAICILGFALAFKLNFFKKMAKTVYLMVMGGIAMIGVILFLVFPAGEVRDVIRDNNVSSDLGIISNSIQDYYEKNNKLPDSLKDLTFENNELHYKLKEYEYSVTSMRSSRGASYQICAVFRKSNKGDITYNAASSIGLTSDIAAPYSYSFYYHDEGRECFSRSVSGGGGVIYDDDYYY